MYKSILYKEWVKTGRLVGILFLVLMAVISYVFILNSQQLRMSGAVNVWETVITQDLPLVASLKWLPLLLSILLSLAQFVPEMQSRRLKLTLHLPMNDMSIMLTMLGYGLLILLLSFALTVAIIAVGFHAWFAPELIANSVWQLAPWFLASFVGYALTAWVCLEPTWRQRLLNTLIAVGILSIFFVPSFSTGYQFFLPILVLLSLISFLFPFFSVARFKEGAH
ncbi:MAG: hypothetical protein ACK5JS_04660 [Mangrovibacterium sp.]